MLGTTSNGLKECQCAPLALTTSQESLNCMSENSKSVIHVGSGCDSSSQKRRDVRKHDVFVLGVDGKPLTPTTNAKARKLINGNQAVPVWNKFGLFGIRMVVQTRREVPSTVLGVDLGTKFEGYSIVVGNENNLNVMWKLPDKEQIVKKVEERRVLRRSRRSRKCRRRKARHNRSVNGFIAPSQLVIIKSRLKAITEFRKCYRVNVVVVEDSRFNHYRNRWGRNFTTMEIGKNMFYHEIMSESTLSTFIGIETKFLREFFGYEKVKGKDREVFESHCSDALAMAASINNFRYVVPGKFLVVDDTYRFYRRKLHKLKIGKNGIKRKYGGGNFQKLSKGTVCNFGQVCGGMGNYLIRFRLLNDKRAAKKYSDIKWVSHKFKTNIGDIPCT